MSALFAHAGDREGRGRRRSARTTSRPDRRSCAPRPAVERRGVVGVVGGRRAIGDDEAVPEDIGGVGSRASPARGRRNRRPARPGSRRRRSRPRHGRRTAGRSRSTSQTRTFTPVTSSWNVRKRRITGLSADGAPRRAVERVSRIESQPVPLDVVVVPVAGEDGQDVGGRVVAEDDLRAVGGTVKAMFAPSWNAALAVVLVPALVDRHLRLVAAGGNRGGLEGVDRRRRPGPAATSAGSPAASRPNSRARTESCPGPSRSPSSCCP